MPGRKTDPAKDKARYPARREAKLATGAATYLRKTFGATRADIDLERVRQGHRCLCCNAPLSEVVRETHIDHDHEKPGTFRGILCRRCNMVLGMVHEDVGILHRMAAYLYRDRAKMLVYIVGSLRNPDVLKAGDALRQQGYDAFDNWMSAGEHADDAWRDYETGRGRTYAEALNGRSARHVFNFDRAHLDMADAAILVMPAGKSGHLELGYVSGRGKPTYILTDGEPERFDVMSQFAPMVTHDLWAIILDLESKRAGLGL